MKSIKKVFILFLISTVILITNVYAIDMYLTNSSDTTSGANASTDINAAEETENPENVTNDNLDNTEIADAEEETLQDPEEETEEAPVTTSTFQPSSNANNYQDEDLTVSDIINIILVSVGIVLILLGIAILIRLK